LTCNNHNDRQLDDLASMIIDSKRTFALTGAGISTDSGIPDFRSPGGFWDKHNPMETSSATILYNNPKLFYEVNIPRYEAIMNSMPNDGHKVLSWLENRGYIQGIITQNIDGLHQKAGSKSVIEIHGSVAKCRCDTCNIKEPMEHLFAQINEGIIPPKCSSCKSILRPDIVLFEDSMDERFFKAQQVLTGCDLLLIIGTSLQVYPAAYLPDKAKKLVIINKSETPWDSYAHYVFNCEITSNLMKIKAILEAL